MLVWRFCARGRLWAAMLVVMAAAPPARAASGVEARRAEFRARASAPAAIATLAALVEEQDSLPPGELGALLREMVDGKLGPVDPLVEAQASYLLSLDDDRNGRFVEAERRRKALALSGAFWVLGPFDSQGRTGLDHAFPAEEEGATLDPGSGKTYAGKERPVSWRRLPAEAFVQGAVLLDALLRPSSDAVAYCLTYVESDRDRWAVLRLGSAGPVKAWLGGRPVWSRDAVRPAWPDQDAAAVHLRRGSNLLVIKTVAVRGPWRLFARLTDPEGNPLAGSTMRSERAGSPARLGREEKAPAIRDLGTELRASAQHASRAGVAQAWLDYALFLDLVSPADTDLHAVEEAAKSAVPPAGPPGPAAIAALLLLGKVAREEDDRRAALERVLPALPSARQRADAQATIGNLWRAQRRDEAAVAAWRKAIATDPGCAPAQIALAREERKSGLTAAALTRILAMPEAARALPVVKDALAESLSALGRRQEAESARQAMLPTRRTDLALLRDLASSARVRGDLRAAGALYAEAARWRPDLTTLAIDTATMLEGQGDLKGAGAVLAAASARLPGDAGLPEELGRLLARAGKTDAALAEMRRSLELRPQNPGLRRYLETLAAVRKAKPESRSVEDLAAENAADGEALARDAFSGVPATDDASAEVLLDRTAVRVHANGLAERFVQRLVHARTERAARESRQTVVRFEPGRQEVEIRKARILRKSADGGVEISEATGRDEESLSEPWYGLYYDTRVSIVTFENLRAGDVVEVQYTVVDVGHHNELADYFGDFEMIADTWPTRRWDYTLIAPASRTFYFNQPRWPGVGPERETRGSEVRYRFAAAKVPRVVSEPSMPGFAEVAPYLHVSTYQTWADVGRWYWNLVADQMQDDGSLKKAAAEATRGARTVEEKVRAIHRLVVEKTRYVGLEFGIHGYKPYRSTQVLERRFGDCKDKATLFVTLLGTVGVDADLVLLRTRRGGRIDELPASLAVFDHAIAYVPSLDRYVDGTAEFSGLGELPAEDQDTMALRVSAREVKLVRTPVLPADQNLARRQWQVELHPDGSARVVEDLSVVGQAAHEWRSYYQTEGERRERFAKSWSGRYAGAQLESLRMELADSNRPVVVHAEVSAPQLGEKGEGGQVGLPSSSREANLASTYARLGERRWPLVLGYAWRHEETVRYHLPKGARIVRLVGTRNLQNQFGGFTMATETSPDGVTIRSTFLVTQTRISPGDYPAFRAFLRDADAALEERLIVDLGRAP
jgi:cellulose synthase operon protein C